MKYKLIIDKESEEEIIAIVQAPSVLTEQIENLVLSYTGKDRRYSVTNRGISRHLAFSCGNITVSLNPNPLLIPI